VSAYESLAFSYDALTYDVPYPEIAAFFERVLKRSGVEAQTVLDLACGTGSLSLLLAQKGYSVLGVDCSEEMLTVASEKSMELALPEPPFWICQKMQRLRLPYPVDAAVCSLDSVNYVTKPSDLQEAFRRVFAALKPHGLFLFGINTPYKLRGLDGQVFLDETEDAYCVWRTEYSEKRRLCHYGIDLFQRDGDVWLRSQEEHTEYAYTPEELTGYLRVAGFRNIQVYGDRKLRAPREDELRIWIAAEKEKLQTCTIISFGPSLAMAMSTQFRSPPGRSWSVRGICTRRCRRRRPHWAACSRRRQ